MQNCNASEISFIYKTFAASAFVISIINFEAGVVFIRFAANASFIE
jgi:hypothetical protein